MIPAVRSDTGEKAAIGGMAGFVIGIAALAIPGIGPVIAAGPLAMALTGAAAGAATGGLIGVLPMTACRRKPRIATRKQSEPDASW